MKAPDPAPVALALDAKALAAALHVSLRTIRVLDSGGKLPKPIRLGRSVRWPTEELCDWLRAGAPNRETWETLRRNGKPER